MPQTFSKKERLCSRKAIEELFNRGNSFFCHPFRVVWLVSDTDAISQVQMTPTVPVRHFRKAVTRNLLKRRIREAYRKNKEQLYLRLSPANLRLTLILQYTCREVMGYREIETGVAEALRKLADRALETVE